MEWSRERVRRLRLLYPSPDVDVAVIAELFGISCGAVKVKAWKLRLRRPDPVWPRERELQLVALWKAGQLSAAQIARKLRVTKNAVIGKADRLKAAGILQARSPRNQYGRAA